MIYVDNIKIKNVMFTKFKDYTAMTMIIYESKLENDYYIRNIIQTF